MMAITNQATFDGLQQNSSKTIETTTSRKLVSWLLTTSSSTKFDRRLKSSMWFHLSMHCESKEVNMSKSTIRRSRSVRKKISTGTSAKATMAATQSTSSLESRATLLSVLSKNSPDRPA